MLKTLRELRIEKGMTLADVAALLGCAVSGPGSWERGRYGPGPRQIPRLAAALGITPEDARKAVELSAPAGGDDGAAEGCGGGRRKDPSPGGHASGRKS